ncbi:hypothetical protein NOS3756_35620 [Nostoc sp. NIES-3756]|uniref:NIL domain-containing protein n=1 Tax=Nostoc sp. NIES-3756 TaxID=1751286 RepID=UPI00071F08C3|nr:NIL domain-containing protein [Nostoc sp. NIES-3756]BAT54590.1 hypothetical protein NOS3756_35620 [Nostoc sp. NIES-3756]BAY37839.1 hypothetical protein NIES2111_21800 [Nostoc sp. NIES-2111]
MSSRQLVKPAPVHSRILVPQLYHRQPVISRLVSRYGLTVNIKAASLVSGTEGEGWFDLDLLGKPQQVTNGLSYLQGLGVNVVQVAIANHIQLHQTPYPFLNPSDEHRPVEFSQWQEKFPQQISQEETKRLRLQLCILKNYYEKPIISQLVSRYKLTVNIISAKLQPNQRNDGWFELDLWGKTKQLYSSLTYLEKLGLPIWLN